MGKDVIVTLTKDNFKEMALEADRPVLVDFWAEWCGPCRMVGPIVDELAEDYEDKVVVAKLNVDDESELAIEYKVMSIPTLILFKDGEVAEKIVGARPKEDLEELLDEYIVIDD